MKRLAVVSSGALVIGLLTAAVVYAQTSEPTAASGWSRADVISVATVIIQVLFLGAGTFLFLQWRHSTKETFEGRIALLEERLKSTEKNCDDYKLLADDRLAFLKDPKDDAEKRLSEVMQRAGIDLQAPLASGPVALDPALKEGTEEVLRRLEQLETVVKTPEVAPPRERAALEHLMRGNAHSAVGDYQAAIEAYSQAIHLQPDDAMAYSNRGVAYDNLEQHQRAIEDYDKAIQLQPDDAEAYYNRGFAYAHLGQHQRAIEDYANGYYNRACANALLGKPKEALADLEKAIELDGKYREMTHSDTSFDNIREDPRFGKLVGLEKQEALRG